MVNPWMVVGLVVLVLLLIFLAYYIYAFIFWVRLFKMLLEMFGQRFKTPKEFIHDEARKVLNFIIRNLRLGLL